MHKINWTGRPTTADLLLEMYRYRFMVMVNLVEGKVLAYYKVYNIGYTYVDI